ncbi:TPA: proteasome subunit beta [Candidatus Woesearchaeota archaeon]|nr:proteasome subunit beta [Candidatus Woesearchaeota archaeon]
MQTHQLSPQLVKTGTTTIGLVCKDGVVLLADKKATAGTMIVDKHAKKIHQIDDAIGVTIAGLVSDAQYLTKLARAEIKLKKIRTDSEVTIAQAANVLANLSYYNLRKMSMVPGIVGFLIAGRDSLGFHLYNIGIDGSITEEKDYTSDGSGSIFVYGVLETLYKKDMTVEEGVALGKKALHAAIQRDAASGCGFDIVVINHEGFKRIESKDINFKIE